MLKNKGKWEESAAFNEFKERMAKMLADVKNEPVEEEAEEETEDTEGDYPSVSLTADSSSDKGSREAAEISDAAYEAATYEGAV